MLVFALVSPVGTPDGPFKGALRDELRSFGYEVETVKLSELLLRESSASADAIRDLAEHERIGQLIRRGDEFCRDNGSAAAMAGLAVREILTQRVESDGEDAWRARRAWIIDSVKRVAEISELREVYGDHLVVIALDASAESREAELRRRITTRAPSRQQYEVENDIHELIARDLSEAASDKYGQNVLRAFPMADVFVYLSDGATVSADTRRLLDLLFGSPAYSVPSESEFGMYMADVASTRSPELGLKVGAAFMRDYAVLSLGTNAHPEHESRSPERDDSTVEVQRILIDTLQGLNADNQLSEEARSALSSDPDGFARGLLAGALAKSRLRDLTEFQPPVHAEMAGILDAVASGQSLDGATVYVTSYPCHGCAKHLLRLGLSVVYLEPYPKSRAEAMYGAAARFKPFTGVAPRRYRQLFASAGDRKVSDGTRLSWSAKDKESAAPVLNRHSLVGVKEREAILITRTLAAQGAPE